MLSFKYLLSSLVDVYTCLLYTSVGRNAGAVPGPAQARLSALPAGRESPCAPRLALRFAAASCGRSASAPASLRRRVTNYRFLTYLLLHRAVIGNCSIIVYNNATF